MSLTHIRKPTLIVLSLLLALAVLSLAPQPAAPASGGNAIALKAPSFVKIANAQEEPAAAPTGFPQDEAGISAYFKSATPVNLADVRSVYRVIEAETVDYIIGSVPVPGYAEGYDVHLYIHRTGWFLVYYLAAAPTAKIVDWVSYNKTAIPVGSSVPTILDKVLRLAATTGGVAFSSATYYDFRYPNATNIILVAEDTWNGDQFEVNLPGSYAYYERSWSAGAQAPCNGTVYVRLDGAQIAASGWCQWWLALGTLTPAQVLPDTYHTVRIHGGDGYVGLALTYRVP